MTCRSIVAATAMTCFAATCARAGAARDAVVDLLRAQGLREGVNENGRVVAVGVAAWSALVPYGLAARLKDDCFKIASIEARAEILKTLCMETSAGKSSAFAHDGTDAGRAVEAAVEALASRTLAGWRVVASGEDFRDGRYSAAVAVAWSRECEETVAAAKERRIFHGEGWRGELDAFLDSDGALNGSGVEVFVDSSGYPHILGVGRADWDGRAATKNARASAAIALAKKNLLLALYGDAAVREKAVRMMGEGRKGVERFGDVKSLYSSLAEVEVSMPLPKGTRDLRLMTTRGDESGGKTIVSVFGFEPEPPPAVPEAVRRRNEGVSIWNPLAGKFEKGEQQ